MAMENDHKINLADTSMNDLMAVLRSQGITTLEDLVEKTVGTMDEMMSGMESESHGCCLVCSSSGHGYVYVVVSDSPAAESAN
jgi:hypothetical protein